VSRLIRPYNSCIGSVVSVRIADPMSGRDIGEVAQSETAQMLVDSGASDSSIALPIAERLRLPVLGYHQITGFGATKATYQFLSDIEILLDDGIYTLEDWKLLSFETEYNQIDGLLGRDILSKAQFVLNGSQATFELDFGRFGT
jgi:hypothetical protein